MNAIKCLLTVLMLDEANPNRAETCRAMIEELYDKGHINKQQRAALLEDYLVPTVFVIMSEGTIFATYRTLGLAKAQVEDISLFPLTWPEYKAGKPLIATDEQGMLADKYKIVGTKIHYHLPGDVD
jgi:hypothetical protein